MKEDKTTIVRNFIESCGCTLISLTCNSYKEKLIIKCACNSNFETSFEKFKGRNKRQCNSCGYKKRNEKNQITIEAVQDFVHSNSECHFISVERMNENKQIIVTLKCNCGEIFTNYYYNFVNSNHKMCANCLLSSRKYYRQYDYAFIKDYIENQTDCCLLSSTYEGSKKPLSLKCGCGFVFSTTFNELKNMNRVQCKKCGYKNISKLKSSGIDSIRNFIHANSDCILLSEFYQNNITPLKLKCRCNEIFYTTFSSFKSQNKRQCNYCSKIYSHGELKIKEYLDENNLTYEHNYKFPDLVYKLQLKFDFAVFNKEKIIFLIEYDGIQHYESIEHFGGEEYFEDLKIKDNLKNHYCISNSLYLIRIPYWDYENIDKILNKELQMTIPS